MSLLAPFVELEQVALLACSANSTLDPRGLPEQAPTLSLSQQCSGVLQAGNRIQVTAHAVFSGHIDGIEVLSIQASYGVYYRLPDQLKPSEKDVQEFAEQNGMFNAWPYLRELLGNLSAKMGLPLPPLPLLRVQQGAAEAAEE